VEHFVKKNQLIQLRTLKVEAYEAFGVTLPRSEKNFVNKLLLLQFKGDK